MDPAQSLGSRPPALPGPQGFPTDLSLTFPLPPCAHFTYGHNSIQSQLREGTRQPDTVGLWRLEGGQTSPKGLIPIPPGAHIFAYSHTGSHSHSHIHTLMPAVALNDQPCQPLSHSEEWKMKPLGVYPIAGTPEAQ